MITVKFPNTKKKIQTNSKNPNAPDQYDTISPDQVSPPEKNNPPATVTRFTLEDMATSNFGENPTTTQVISNFVIDNQRLSE